MCFERSIQKIFSSEEEQVTHAYLFKEGSAARGTCWRRKLGHGELDERECRCVIYKLDNGGVETSLCDGFGGGSSESQDVEWQCFVRSESRAWCLLCIACRRRWIGR